MMVPGVNRRGDDDDPEAWQQRRLRSLSHEEVAHFAKQAGGNAGQDVSALIIGWGNKSLAVRGIAVIVFLMLVSVIASVGAAHYLSNRDHEAIRRSQDRMSCILTLTAEERSTFRENYHPGAWSRLCAWLPNEQ